MTKRRDAHEAVNATRPVDDPRFVALCKALAADPRYASVVADHAARRGTTTRRRFGANALTINGRIFAMMAQGTLVVKLPRDRVDVLVAEGGGRRFDPGHGRVMQEWLAVAASARDWLPLVQEAHEFVAPGTGATTRRKQRG